MRCLLLTTALLTGAVGVLSAQTLDPPVTPTPRPADVETLDGIIAAFYDVISGPVGMPRQWDRDRTLYWPGVRFFSLGIREGKPHATVMTHDHYVEASNDWMVQNGFYEVETTRRVNRFGNMAHAWSQYAYRQTPDGPVTGRGINSIQLYHDGSRWWITAVIWDNERPDNPLPPVAP